MSNDYMQGLLTGFLVGAGFLSLAWAGLGWHFHKYKCRYDAWKVEQDARPPGCS